MDIGRVGSLSGKMRMSSENTEQIRLSDEWRKKKKKNNYFVLWIKFISTRGFCNVVWRCWSRADFIVRFDGERERESEIDKWWKKNWWFVDKLISFCFFLLIKLLSTPHLSTFFLKSTSKKSVGRHLILFENASMWEWICFFSFNSSSFFNERKKLRWDLFSFINRAFFFSCFDISQYTTTNWAGVDSLTLLQMTSIHVELVLMCIDDDTDP